MMSNLHALNAYPRNFRTTFHYYFTIQLPLSFQIHIFKSKIIAYP